MWINIVEYLEIKIEVYRWDFIKDYYKLCIYSKYYIFINIFFVYYGV